ncbi:MAG: hypothetical protein J6Y53_03885 [Alphaproteobacteria bacterium]|nr:hypothetical protein [Alphaproteobacteria bacterium]
MEEETIPGESLRKLNSLFIHNKELLKNKKLQQEIIAWAKEMQAESREEWCEMRATSTDAAIKIDRKQQAINRGKQRDKKYAPFRDYFKNLQYRHFKEYQKSGKTLSARAFVIWFLKNKAKTVDIPYKNTNIENKLNQLAQANNREFKKAFANYS